MLFSCVSTFFPSISVQESRSIVYPASYASTVHEAATTRSLIVRCSGCSLQCNITSNYEVIRKLSRKLHPDKNANNEAAREQLERVREAYEILKDDCTRLPYHEYGLLDISQAVVLLTGKGMSEPAYRDLLRLMGYDYHNFAVHKPSHSERVAFIAADLVERIRPLVEGVVKEENTVEDLIRECDRLKRLPLGSQILRCIGRAYRYSGQKVLRRYHAKKSIPVLPDKGIDLTDSLREQWWNAKWLFTAAVASGRAVVTEQLAKRQQEQLKVDLPYLTYKDRLGMLPMDEDNACYDDVPSNDEIKEQERLRTQETLLESLQLEALWKISKVDLDRTIREACDKILSGDYFFFPSHQTSDWSVDDDGWVGAGGEVIEVQVGRIRAAAALVMLGDVMVERSKHDTSWKD